MIKKILFFAMLLVSPVYAAINSVTITTATLSASLNCLHYKIPTKACVWLSPISGKNITPYLDHYLPDLVVVVYRNANDNPWDEVRLLYDAPIVKAQSSIIQNVGSGNHSLQNSYEQQVIFKEADVIGNPAIIIFKDDIKMVLLKSTARPMKPYYQSMLDSALWRGFMPEAAPEEAAAITLNVPHHIGTGLNDWGGLYPHEGSVIANNDLKGSMVIAERATDLLTNQQVFGHIRDPLSTRCGKHCKAYPITENSQDTLFQMIYPVQQTECVPLGSDKSYSDAMLNETGSYMWIVWRHYQGCPDGHGQFLGVI